MSLYRYPPLLTADWEARRRGGWRTVTSLLGAGPYYIHLGSYFLSFGGLNDMTFTSLRVVDGACETT